MKYFHTDTHRPSRDLSAGTPAQSPDALSTPAPVGRLEQKYLINTGDYWAIRARLKVLMRPDPHGVENGTYRIRSLYFDNADDKELCEKLAGVRDREKFRLRSYNDDFSFIRLEKKAKRNNLYLKETVPVTQAECAALLAGEIGMLATSGKALLQELAEKMRLEQLAPRTIVEYTREAYVYAPGNIRINFDTKVRTGLCSTDFLNPKLHLIPVASQKGIILEVKYRTFMPDVISGALVSGSRRPEAISKYVAAREYELL